MFKIHSAQYFYPYPRIVHHVEQKNSALPNATISFQPLFTSFLLTSLLFMAHGLEEYFGGFQSDDPVWQWFYGLVFPAVHQYTAFLIFHFLFWLGLIVTLLIIARGRIPYFLMSAVAVVMFLEIYHVVLAGIQGRYVGGLVTSLLLLLAGIWFGTELVKAWLRKPYPTKEGAQT